MSTSDLNKEYLKYTKEEARKWHFYLGGDPAVETNADPNSFDWGRDVNLLYRIRENDVNFVTNRQDWRTNIRATPWNPNSQDDSNTLFFNVINSIAYLCVSDNENNRSDSVIRGRNLSKFSPSHTNGLQTYPDGYSWYALFVVDASKLDLISTNKIPVMSIDDFSQEITSTSLTQAYSQECQSGATGQGTCCIYSKNETRDAFGNITSKGDLTYVKLVTDCYRCTELALKLNGEYVFKSGITNPPAYPTCTPCDCSIVIENKIDKIANNLETLNPSGFFRHIYENYQGWEDPSEILSVFINLSGLSDAEKTVTSQNPQVLFDSITGTDAVGELLTDDIGGGRYLVKGIRLVSRGRNYRNGDANPRIVGFETSILNRRIEVNVAPEDFPENPISMLNNLETCIKVSVNNRMLEDSQTNLRNFTKYGILKEVKLDTNDTNASDGLNKNEYQFLRATTILTLGLTTTNQPIDIPEVEV
jgi:hypothetical protein